MPCGDVDDYVCAARLVSVAFSAPVSRISLFARDSRDLREKRDGPEVSSSGVTPGSHVLLVSLTHSSNRRLCEVQRVR